MEKSWNPGGVTSESWAGVVECGLCQVSVTARMLGLSVWIVSWMYEARLSWNREWKLRLWMERWEEVGPGLGWMLPESSRRMAVMSGGLELGSVMRRVQARMK